MHTATQTTREPGTTPTSDGVRFEVWAPKRRRVEVVIEGGPGAGVEQRLERDDDGWFSGVVADAAAGGRYRYRLDRRTLVPDPASRFQPDGPHGASEVVDTRAFRWTDPGWPGVAIDGQVLYEMHVGTFSPAGTWAGAMPLLPALADTGITVLELMPVAEFPGRFGWGYDGVDLFAPFHHYGRPEEMCAFIDRAHGLGLGVLLDVVYNHLGPDGCYQRELSDDYFSRTHGTDWGEGINFDGRNAEHVRAFYRANVRHWIREYHLDGLRVDATQDIHDDSDPHILAELATEARAAAGNRSVLIIAENEPQDVRTVRPRKEGGFGFDGMWNDDAHHSAVVALTGRRHAYYGDYHGSPQELLSIARHGFLYQGQHYAWQGKRRGTPTSGVRQARLVAYLENHDQVANSEHGDRLITMSDPSSYRALTAWLLLSPGTPLLFQGQEYGATTPWRFFAHHEGDLGRSVREGRADFLMQFANIAALDRSSLPDPTDAATFEASRLDPDERAHNEDWRALHRDLLRLRRQDTTIARAVVDGAVLATTCLLIRYEGAAGDDRLLIMNLGPDLDLVPAPEPLLAPPPEQRWALLWSSEDARYGGRGTPQPETENGWRIPARCALLLSPSMREPASKPDESHEEAG